MLLALVDGYLKLAAAAAQGDETAAREALRLAAETAVQLQSTPVSAQVVLHQARHDLAQVAGWIEQFAMVLHAFRAPARRLTTTPARSTSREGHSHGEVLHPPRRGRVLCGDYGS